MHAALDAQLDAERAAGRLNELELAAGGRVSQQAAARGSQAKLGALGRGGDTSERSDCSERVSNVRVGPRIADPFLACLGGGAPAAAEATASSSSGGGGDASGLMKAVRGARERTRESARQAQE